MSYRALTSEEQAALTAFAAAHNDKRKLTRGCANWRDELSMVYWYNARIWRDPITGEDRHGTTLHGIRNQFGVEWLYDHCPVK